MLGIWNWFGGSGIGNLIAIVALVIAFVTLRTTVRQAQKRVRCDLIGTVPLVTVNEEIGKHLEIRVLDRVVTDLSVVTFELKNTGSVAILPSDFERPLTIQCGKNATIVAASVYKTIPDRVQVKLKQQGQEVILEPQTFNKGDSIFVSLLAEGFDGQYTFDTRVAGISTPESGDQTMQRRRILFVLDAAEMTFYLWVFVSFLLATAAVRRTHLSSTQWIVGSVALGFATALTWHMQTDESGAKYAGARWHLLTNIVVWAACTVVWAIWLLLP